MSEKMNDEKINVPEHEVNKQKHCEDDCGRTTLVEMGADIEEYKTGIIDEIPVAVGWKKHGGNGYKSTMDTNGNAYIGRNKKGTLVLYIVIHSKYGMYQIQINKKRMSDMLKNAMIKDMKKPHR